MSMRKSSEYSRPIRSAAAAASPQPGRILPVGRERDPEAQVWQLVPTEGLYVVPAVEQDLFWFHHFTVEVEAHCVDALTGVDGTTRETYLDRYWTDIDAIAWVPTEKRPHEPW
jgi:hypothetical protein